MFNCLRVNLVSDRSNGIHFVDVYRYCIILVHCNVDFLSQYHSHVHHKPRGQILGSKTYCILYLVDKYTCESRQCVQ